MKHILALCIIGGTIVVMSALMLTVGCDFEKSTFEEKSNDNGHEWFQARTYKGNNIPIHNPDCKKCEEKLRNVIREEMLSVMNSRIAI